VTSSQAHQAEAPVLAALKQAERFIDQTAVKVKQKKTTTMRRGKRTIIVEIEPLDTPEAMEAAIGEFVAGLTHLACRSIQREIDAPKMERDQCA
jgi:hypothetical protein